MLSFVRRYVDLRHGLGALRPATPSFKAAPESVSTARSARPLLGNADEIEVGDTDKWQRLPLNARRFTLTGRISPDTADTNGVVCRVRYLQADGSAADSFGEGLSVSERAGGYFYPQRNVVDEAGTFERVLVAPEGASAVEINLTRWRKSAEKVRAARQILLVPHEGARPASDGAGEDPLPVSRIARKLSALPEASIMAAVTGELAGGRFVDIPRRDYWQVLDMEGARYFRLLALCKEVDDAEQGDIVVRFRFFDERGRGLTRRVPGLAQSERAGHYRYLSGSAGRGIISETFLAPKEAVRMAVAVQLWRQVAYRPRISSTMLLLPLE